MYPQFSPLFISASLKMTSAVEMQADFGACISMQLRQSVNKPREEKERPDQNQAWPGPLLFKYSLFEQKQCLLLNERDLKLANGWNQGNSFRPLPTRKMEKRRMRRKRKRRGHFLPRKKCIEKCKRFLKKKYFNQKHSYMLIQEYKGAIPVFLFFGTVISSINILCTRSYNLKEGGLIALTCTDEDTGLLKLFRQYVFWRESIENYILTWSLKDQSGNIRN